jgi:hypothetical protein
VAADQSVALDVKTPAPPEVPTFNPASPLASAQDLLGNQTKLQMLNRQNAGEDIQFRNSLISNAAAHALDADSWDAAMRAAVQKGAPEAAQYVGRYTPLLQQRLFDAYTGSGGAQGQGAAPAAATGGTPAGGTATSPDMLDRMYANVSPQQMAQSLQKNNMILQALSTVKDQQSYDRAISWLGSNGIPNAAQIAGPYNPLQVLRLWNDTQQRVGYLQNRVAAASTGAPNPLIKNDVSTVGDVAYSVDPYKGTATAMTPPKWAVTDTTDMFGQKRPIAYNPLNPNESVSVGRDVPAATAASPFTAFASKMNQAESGGAPNAKNPLSSAAGPGQFIDQTWLDTVKTARPDLAKGMTDQQILALRSNPQLAQDMTEAYARSNATKLSDAGLPVTTATLALAHRFGPDGAETILHAAPNDKLSDILPKKVIDANPQLAGMTAGQYAQTVAKQFGNTTVNAVQTPSLNDFDPAKIDSNLAGWDYAAQFPVEVQDAAKAYMNGGTMPSGNPRNQGIVTMAKMVAQKVATDLGRPELADDTLYPQRRQMQVELGKTTSPQAVGGQITFGGTALGHLATYAEDLADLGNWTAGFTTAGHAVNWVRAEDPSQSGKINKASSDAQHYGQEISKFYAGGPAGEAERSRFLNANAGLDPKTATPEELAGLIRGERDLIPERFAQIKGNIENVLGPEAAAKALARMDVKGSMDRINMAIAKLDPSGPEAQALKAQAAPAAGAPAAAPTFTVGRVYKDSVSGDLARYNKDGSFSPVPAGTK